MTCGNALRATLALLAIAALSAGCSRPASVAAGTASPQQLQEAYAWLVQGRDPDSLAAAALTARGLADAPAHPTRALEMANRAVAGAPARADLAVLQMQLCEVSPGCDPQAAEAHQRQLDASNGISWLYALQRANRRQDAQDSLAALAGLAAAQRLDLHWTGLASRMTVAMARPGGIDAATALNTLIEEEGALHLPLKSISDACSPEAVRAAVVRDLCRGTSEMLQHADTVQVAMYGNRLAVRLWADDPARRAELAIRGRALEYQMDVLRTSSGQFDSPRALQLQAKLYPHYATEQGVIRALYLALGLRADPPQQWRQPVFAGKL